MVTWKELGLDNPYTLSFLKMELDNLTHWIKQLSKPYIAFGHKLCDIRVIDAIRSSLNSYLITKEEYFDGS